MAWSDDGLVEALYAPDRHFLWAVQWHPEFMYPEDKNARLLFSALAEAAGHS
uniref:gamma-glutamyl-gamma-aminobutyrate hydrolase family protein n=1 Tax=Porcincola intestinalis TaxID=2606632 RepID=UPI001F42272C|nr:gamma-glutamyl-gamma-aminobutyrate hydrolase family protein [Porcincola intestinalis]